MLMMAVQFIIAVVLLFGVGIKLGAKYMKLSKYVSHMRGLLKSIVVCPLLNGLLTN